MSSISEKILAAARDEPAAAIMINGHCYVSEAALASWGCIEVMVRNPAVSERIADLCARIEKAEAERAHIKPLAWETVEAKRHCVARSIVGTYVAMHDAWWMRETAAMEEKIDGLEAAKAAAQADYEARIRSALKSSPPTTDQG